MNFHTRTLVLLLGMGVGLCSSGTARALEVPEAYISDFTVTQVVSGVSVTFPGKIYLGADFSVTAAPVIQVHAIVDLGGLQGKIPAIVNTIALPTNNCASYSPKNAVTLSDEQLNFSGGQAVFHTGGKAVIWECVQNPVPCTKVTMQMKKVGPIKTKVPVVQSYACNPPVKTILGTQPFALDAPFSLKVDNGGTLQLVPGNANLTLSGPYVDITKGILDAFKVNLNAKLNDAIQKSLNPKTATISIPKEYLNAGLAFQDATFVTVGGNLGVDVRANVKVTTTAVKTMGQLLYDALKKKL